MPYIKQKRGEYLDRYEVPAGNSGELNYLITRLCIKYIKRHGLCYQSINDIRGALVNASDEFYRRIAAPYEDLKIEENGDVYEDVYEDGILSRSNSRL